MEPFWPTLPYLIPTTQGTPMWWYIFWWIFQIVVMTGLVLILTRWAMNMDRVKNENAKETMQSTTRNETLHS